MTSALAYVLKKEIADTSGNVPLVFTFSGAFQEVLDELVERKRRPVTDLARIQTCVTGEEMHGAEAPVPWRSC